MSTTNYSVLLTAYRRLRHFRQQLAAVQNQSVPPQAIWVFYNEPPGLKSHEVPSVAMPGVDNVIHCQQNLGVWPRFPLCLEFSTPYVMVLDDDTIPGKHWAANCIRTMQTHRGLLGTVGVIFPHRTRRPYWRWGWVRPSHEVQEVDIVGHSWFFERDWLRNYVYEPRGTAESTCGEDYHFSVAIQRQLGLPTFVPPHPADATDQWGSIKGKLGQDKVALHRSKPEERKKNAVHQAYLNRGWRLLCDRDPEAVKRLGRTAGG